MCQSAGPLSIEREGALTCSNMSPACFEDSLSLPDMPSASSSHTLCKSWEAEQEKRVKNERRYCCNKKRGGGTKLGEEEHGAQER